jgi:hypothetical protein
MDALPVADTLLLVVCRACHGVMCILRAIVAHGHETAGSAGAVGDG